MNDWGGIELDGCWIYRERIFAIERISSMEWIGIYHGYISKFIFHEQSLFVMDPREDGFCPLFLRIVHFDLRI